HPASIPTPIRSPYRSVRIRYLVPGYHAMELVQERRDIGGVLGGLFVALVGLGTLAGQPWQYSGGVIVILFQILGAVSAVAVGGGLIYLVASPGPDSDR
ncbi:MAG: hypothetical protein ABEJ58_10915, partial [Halodesulfurarchaeum sp.]